MKNPKLPVIESFFDRYRQFILTLNAQHIEQLTSTFEKFKINYTPFKQRMAMLRRQEAPFYNIFDVLNINHRETKLHTPFLVHLLNPNASHDQGTLFLNHFLSQVIHTPYRFEDLEHFKIYEELAHSKGRIDIVLFFEVLGYERAIVIENKIYAVDQGHQLQRYADFLVNERGIHPDHFRLVYLTPNGDLPSSISLDPQTTQRWIDAGKLSPLSYQHDVKNWLLECLDQVKSEKVRFIIVHVG